MNLLLKPTHSRLGLPAALARLCCSEGSLESNLLLPAPCTVRPGPTVQRCAMPAVLQLRHQAIRVHFNRLSDVFSILLLEAAVFLLVVE